MRKMTDTRDFLCTPLEYGKLIHYSFTVSWLAQDVVSTEVSPSQCRMEFKILKEYRHLKSM
jgi:hypothetical protein